MDNARKAGAIGGQDQVFARNRLVIIAPRDNPRKIAAVKDLANDGVKSVTAASGSCSAVLPNATRQAVADRLDAVVRQVFHRGDLLDCPWAR